MKIIKIAIFLALSFVMSCDEGNEVIIHPDALLIWTGGFDNGGCGFFIEMDSVRFKPVNEGIIPPAFRKRDPLKITVQYIDLMYEMEFDCGEPQTPHKSKAIKLQSMDLNQELD